MRMRAPARNTNVDKKQTTVYINSDEKDATSLA